MASKRVQHGTAWYLKRKKILEQFYSFSFKNPRKGRDFESQQKSAISRKWAKIEHLIKDGELSDKVSFIKYPKGSRLPKVDAIRTNKGLIYKLPHAKAIKDRKSKKYRIIAKTGERYDIFFPFPSDVIFSLDKIQIFVNDLVERYKPDTVRWSTLNRRESNDYAPEIFTKYTDVSEDESDDNEQLEAEIDYLMEFIETPEFEELQDYEQRDYYRRLSYLKKKREDAAYYNGVFLVWWGGNKPGKVKSKSKSKSKRKTKK